MSRIVKPHNIGFPLYNKAHPLAKGLVFGVIPGGMHRQDIVSGNFPLDDVSSGNYGGVTQIGRAWESNSTSDGGISWPITDQVKAIKAEYTVVYWQESDSLDTFAAGFSIPYRSGSWSSPFVCMQLQVRNGADGRGAWGKAVSGNLQKVNIADDYISADGTPVTCYAISQKVDLFAYRDGKFFNSQTFNTGSVDWTDSYEIVLGQRSTTSVGEGLDGRLPGAYLWNRALSDKEISQIFADPFLFIRSSKLKFGRLSEAVGNFTGTSNFLAISDSPGFTVGSFSGTSDFPAVGLEEILGVGAFTGTSDFSAVGLGPSDSVGAFVGTSNFPAIATATADAVGAFAGTSAFPGVGLTTAIGVGAFAGASAFPAVGLNPNEGVGIFQGTSNFFGVGSARDLTESTGQRFGKGIIGNTGGRGGVARSRAGSTSRIGGSTVG